MLSDSLLEELFDLFVREEVPAEVRAAIAHQFGENRYLLAKEAVLAGLSDSDAFMRDACIEVVSYHWQLKEVGPKLLDMMENDE